MKNLIDLRQIAHDKNFTKECKYLDDWRKNAIALHTGLQLVAGMLLARRGAPLPDEGTLPHVNIAVELASRPFFGWAHTGIDCKIDWSADKVMDVKVLSHEKDEFVHEPWNAAEIRRHYELAYHTDRLSHVPTLWVVSPTPPEQVEIDGVIKQGMIVNGRNELEIVRQHAQALFPQGLISVDDSAKAVLRRTPPEAFFELPPRLVVPELSEDERAPLLAQWEALKRAGDELLAFAASPKGASYSSFRGTLYDLFRKTVPLPNPRAHTALAKLVDNYKLYAEIYQEALIKALPEASEGLDLEKIIDRRIQFATPVEVLGKLSDMEIQRINPVLLFESIGLNLNIDKYLLPQEQPTTAELRKHLVALIQSIEKSLTSRADIVTMETAVQTFIANSLSAKVQPILETYQAYLKEMSPSEEPLKTVLGYSELQSGIQKQLDQAFKAMGKSKEGCEQYVTLVLQLAQSKDIDILQKGILIVNPNLQHQRSRLEELLSWSPEPPEGLFQFWDKIPETERMALSSLYRLASSDLANDTIKLEYGRAVMDVLDRSVFQSDQLFNKKQEMETGYNYLEHLVSPQKHRQP